MRALLLLLFALILPLGAAARESLTVLAVPSRAAASQLRALRNYRFALRVRSVFTPSEAKALAKLGDPALGHSQKLEFASPAALARFSAWAKIHAPAFRIEADPRAHTTDTSGDPLRSLQWGLRNTGGTYNVEVDDFSTRQLPAQAGEDIHLDGAPAPLQNVTVAVLDSGVDVNHPDLKAAIVRHEAECLAEQQYAACVAKQGVAKCDPKFKTDHDGNGYPLDCNGWNLAAEDDGNGMARSGPPPKSGTILGNAHVADYIGHGTHVAGIIAAQVNGIGVEGVAPLARILPVRVISGEPTENIRAQDLQGDLPAPAEPALNAGYALGDIVARGVLYAVRSGAQIINMSLGWPDPMDSELMRRMLALARQKNVLIVAAAGNDSTDSVIFPCRYDGVICVGAHGPDGALTFFSNYGYGVDVLAPGWNILSTFPTGLLPIHFTDQAGYESKDGTSMSAPFVSGMLARMIGLGMTADEAYSRLILGARPTRPSQIEDPSIFGQASLSGNADLAAAFKVPAQALVLPSKKDPIRIEWDRTSTSVAMRMLLADHWQDAQAATITIAARNPSVRLTPTSWTLPTWSAGAETPFDTQLEILDPRVESELDFDVSVSGANLTPRTFRVHAQLVAPIGPDTASADIRVLPIQGPDGSSLTSKYDEVRTVALDSDSGREYVGIRSDATKAKSLDLLAEAAGVMRLQGTLVLPRSDNKILSVRKVHDPVTGAAGYVLLEGLPVPAGLRSSVGPTQLTWLDPSFHPIAGRAAQVVDLSVTYLTEDFQWQIRAGELVPTWYSYGRTPPAERKPYNPWDPTQNNKPSFRMFMLARDGLHSLDLPKDYPIMISLLPQTPAQREHGIVSVLLGKGSDYALGYATAEVANGQWQSVKALAIPKYRNLHGIVANPVVSLDPTRPFAGTAFSGYVDSDVGPAGSRRTTVINPPSLLDLTALPLRNFDVVADITGTFVGSRRQAQFSLTKYEIQFHDLTDQRSVMTTQKRFSFLPNIFTLKSFFPIAIEDRNLEAITGEPRVPALFVPGDFVYSKATQVIAPLFDSAGRLSALSRPARFHLESKPGCTALATAKPANSAGPAELVFFCGDRFLSVPLIY